MYALTVTSNGEPTFEEYVFVGVVSVVPIVVSPSPQVISYLFALPTAVIVSVTDKPAPPDVTSAVKSTLLTKVLFLTFSSASFKSSIASVTFAVSESVDIAPTGKVDESAGEPSSISLPFCETPPTCASTYAFNDCCVTNAVALFEAILSSSKIVDTATPPSNDILPTTINPSLTVTAVESDELIVSTSIALFSAKVTPVPATVGVIELPALNSKSFVPSVNVDEVELLSEIPIVVTIDDVAEST